jgi:hypothetical protein
MRMIAGLDATQRGRRDVGGRHCHDLRWPDRGKVSRIGPAPGKCPRRRIDRDAPLSVGTPPVSAAHP